MANILVINTSVRGKTSISRTLVEETVARLREADPGASVVARDLGQNPIPHLIDANLAGVRGVPKTGIELETRRLSDELLTELRAADILVIGAPMYNFSISTLLRSWFDYILRAHETFAYSEAGPKGLLSGKRVLVLESRGGLYSVGAEQANDFQEPYLRLLFGFIGLTDVTFIRAEKLGFGPEAVEAAVSGAKARIAALVSPDFAKASATQHQPALRVGVVGLGHMGGAFARNLLADGLHVVAFDRNPAHVSALQNEGAEAAKGLTDLSACDVVVSSLPDDQVLQAVALDQGGLIDVMREGAIHVSMSTISPALSRHLARAHAESRQGYIAAPVLGNPDLARSRTLLVLAAGHPNVIDRAMPVIERLGQRIFVISDDAPAANLMKLAGNVLTATTLQSMGEVLALLRKGGVDQQIAFEVLTNSLFDGKVHKTYGGKILNEQYLPAGMTIPLAVKDLRLALAAAESDAVPMPAASLVHDRLVSVVARGWADLDWSALGLLAAREAGLGSSFLDSRNPEARP
jgi:3-hydroxyisobutyrate dehydrogenase-like beta-hydroxyacid dehydrogenase/FMN-dependent NADH-azoreductase